VARLSPPPNTRTHTPGVNHVGTPRHIMNPCEVGIIIIYEALV